MQARTTNPVLLYPEALKHVLALSKSTQNDGVPRKTLHLVLLRASQINGCSVCVDMHARDAKNEGETDQRLLMVSAWRDTPFFSDAERAALALTEATTRIADRPDAVSDEIWQEAARHYDEKALASLVISIALINFFNRINNATRQLVDPDAARKAAELIAQAH
ncbi:MAG TPA: carboxymuconolactone decarboxylase family protein [Oscillatoriaceae cyanobacterium]